MMDGVDLLVDDESESESSLTSCKRLIDETRVRLLEQYEFKPSLTPESYEHIVAAGFNRVTLPAAFILTQLALELQPITVRGLMYRAQAAGLYPDTSDKFYQQTARIILKLRRKGIIPYSWIVDSTRRRLKPSSWSGLREFTEDAVSSYRRDLWTRQRDYIEFFCEKDAMSALIEPVTEEYDVHLNIIRGQVSETFIWNIAEEWKQITKPIFAYYLGDHDPSGLRIEASLTSRLSAFVEKDFQWERLAITPADFADNQLLGFKVKRKGAPGSWKPYIDEHGDRCVEVDAISPDEIRERVRRTIESHIDQREWEQLKNIEEQEKITFQKTMKQFEKR
jgi:hypothetical protein